jgi:hypothetical protein
VNNFARNDLHFSTSYRTQGAFFLCTLASIVVALYTLIIVPCASISGSFPRRASWHRKFSPLSRFSALALRRYVNTPRHKKAPVRCTAFFSRERSSIPDVQNVFRSRLFQDPGRAVELYSFTNMCSLLYPSGTRQRLPRTLGRPFACGDDTFNRGMIKKSSRLKPFVRFSMSNHPIWNVQWILFAAQMLELPWSNFDEKQTRRRLIFSKRIVFIFQARVLISNSKNLVSSTVPIFASTACLYHNKSTPLLGTDSSIILFVWRWVLASTTAFYALYYDDLQFVNCISLVKETFLYWMMKLVRWKARLHCP